MINKFLLSFLCLLTIPTLIFANKPQWNYSPQYSSKLGTLPPNEYVFAIREEGNYSIFNILKEDKTNSNWSTSCYKNELLETYCLVQEINKEKKERNIGIIIGKSSIKANLLPIEETIYQIDKKLPVHIESKDLFDVLKQYQMVKDLLEGNNLTYKHKKRNSEYSESKTINLKGFKENIEFAKMMTKWN